LLGAEEAYKTVDSIKAAGATVVVPAALLSEREGRTRLLADDLARAGIPVVFQSDREDAARSLPLMAGYAVHWGMNALDALAALTSHPARLFKIDDRVGALEKGKDADLILFDGEPFEIGHPVKRVFVSGKEVRKP
jgi:imidazolonepropionase-like amidohydrolase